MKPFNFEWRNYLNNAALVDPHFRIQQAYFTQMCPFWGSCEHPV
jgi:hypothetical protein